MNVEPQAEYYQQSRPEMLAFLPESPQRILDIGCGDGFFGAAVKQKFPTCETWGVEAVAEEARTAALHNDRVITGLLEETVDLPERHFDAVFMNDVLEHMTWPEPALATAKRILKPQGRLVISLPNVRYFLNVRDLVFKNDWEYQDRGILDRTHFRFYTTRSAENLLRKNGYVVETVVGINQPALSLPYRLLFCLAPKFFYWMRFPQFAIVARPK
jgi:SAM-dependent methyltransferase